MSNNLYSAKTVSVSAWENAFLSFLFHLFFLLYHHFPRYSPKRYRFEFGKNTFMAFLLHRSLSFRFRLSPCALFDTTKGICCSLGIMLLNLSWFIYLFYSIIGIVPLRHVPKKYLFQLKKNLSHLYFSILFYSTIHRFALLVPKKNICVSLGKTSSGFLQVY